MTEIPVGSSGRFVAGPFFEGGPTNSTNLPDEHPVRFVSTNLRRTSDEPDEPSDELGI
jgi:hypothetical protein